MKTPLGGYTMSLAALHLNPPESADSVAAYRDFAREGAHAMVREALRHLWEEVVSTAHIGGVIVYGVKPGADAAAAIDPSLLVDAIPDFGRQTLEIGGADYHSVRVFPALDSPSGRAVGASPKAKSANGRAPEHGDAFIQEMIRFAVIEVCHTRKDLTDHMKQWCAERSDPPSDRSIERWVTRYWPSSLPTK